MAIKTDTCVIDGITVFVHRVFPDMSVSGNTAIVEATHPNLPDYSIGETLFVCDMSLLKARIQEAVSNVHNFLNSHNSEAS